MSFPPRHGIPPMFMGVPPPSLLSIPPPSSGGKPPPLFYSGGPPPSRHNKSGGPHVIQGKPTVNLLPHDHPSPMPVSVPSGPPVTVFVGNITDKWPDAMIRQLLSTCGYVLNWKRVQGASGKLQGFGFCEFGGPDAGLRAVRLLHELEVGDKKLVVKVDAKTSGVFEEFKAEKKKKNVEGPHELEGEIPNEEDEYMDFDMRETDERSRMRINMLFREFKTELDSYMPPGSEKPDKDPTTKQAIQDKLHLLKLTSLDAPMSDANAGDDAVIEEGKREIISQEIVKFREHMKIEKEIEEERKRISKERRERQLDRENFDKVRREKDGSKSPGRRRDRRRSRSQSNKNSPPRVRSTRSRSRLNDRGNRRHDRHDRRGHTPVERVARDRDRERERSGRRRSRERRSRSRNSRDRSSPMAPHKRRYREREEEEEAEEQRKQDKKAREKEALYDEKLRIWEQREEKKRRERQKERDKQERILEQTAREARNMKEFLEDYDDDQLDVKFYKGKDLQKRLSDRTKELETDNRDRQREREEIEDMRLKVLTSGGVLPGTGVIPVITLDRHLAKKPMMDSTNLTNSVSGQTSILPNSKKTSSTSGPSVTARLQALAGQTPPSTLPQISQNNGVHHQSKTTTPTPQLSYTEKRQPQPQTTQTSFVGSQFVSKGRTSNPTTPNSIASPGGAIVEISPSIRSLANTGFTVSAVNKNVNDVNVKDDDDGTRNSYSSANSPAMASPANYERDDDSSLQDMSPDFHKKKKMNVKDVFNQDEEDEAFGSVKKRKLIPLDYGDQKGKKDGGVDDKKRSIKSLIDRIPTEKDALFSYDIDWTMVDNSLMEKRIRPWINKKIIEYIGEPEPTLVDFICTKVLAKSNPAGILEDVQMVLDDEAEVFVVKMWRLLVYEIEAKKIGLAGKS